MASLCTENVMSEFAFLELSECADGEVVLRRSGDSAETEPLVSVRFSAETRMLLGDRVGEIARAMIGAGVQMVTQQMGNAELADDEPRVLH